jgi:hypothetical protein
MLRFDIVDIDAVDIVPDDVYVASAVSVDSPVVNFSYCHQSFLSFSYIVLLLLLVASLLLLGALSFANIVSATVVFPLVLAWHP